MAKKKKIGILGGAFDPPHDGHEALATLAAGHFDNVWVMPCNDHMHKHMTDAKMRLAMCQLAFRDHFPKVIVSGYEIINRRKASSYENIKSMMKDEPDCEFSLIIGQDNADDIESWMYQEQLVKEIPFFVVPRQGYDRKEDAWYSKGIHTYLSDLQESAAIVKVNSTDIRKTIAHGDQPEYVDKIVWEYIRERGIYM